MTRVSFTIPYPSNYGKLYGMNAVYAGKHWAGRKKDAEFWHKYVFIQLRNQNIKQHIFDCPVEITFLWDDLLDLSNEAYAAKMIEDAIKGYLIRDDSKKYVRGIHHLLHRKKCIQVIVEPHREETA